MKLTKPLVFYGAAVYIGCITYIAFNNSLVLGAVFTASFLIIILATIDFRYSIIITAFFILGIICSQIYYSISIESSVIRVRVTKFNQFYSVGDYAGKNINLKGNLTESDEGLYLLVKGKFEAKKDFTYGSVGTFYIDELKREKPDAVGYITNFKTKLYEKFSKELGEGRAALILSLCFGDTRFLKEDQKNDFKQLGVIHAISVSGFHMAVIYKLAAGIFGIWPALAVSLMYVVFTGAQAATLRAFIMIFILKISKKVFKNYDACSSLSLSAILILILKPYYCTDLGFILSYLATLGILLFNDKIRKAIFRLPELINESLSITLSAQVFSMPFAALALNNLSFGFIPGNIILLPIYTALVILGNGALMVYKIDFLFHLLCIVIKLFMLIMDGATFLLLKLTPPMVYLNTYEGFCLLLIIVSFLLVLRGDKRFKFFPMFVFVSLLLSSYRLFPNIEFIDLGESDGIIVEYKSSRILIACDGENITQNISNINSKYKFTKVIKSKEEGIFLRFDKDFAIKTIPDSSRGKAFSLEADLNNHKTIFTRNSSEFIDINLRRYDIIVLPQKKFYVAKLVKINNLKPISYDIVFNRVYPSFTLSGGKE